MAIKQIFIAVDQLLNTLLGGWADETLSARAWRLKDSKARWWIARHVIDDLFFWDVNHCMMSYESERLRLQSPPEVRGDGRFGS